MSKSGDKVDSVGGFIVELTDVNGSENNPSEKWHIILRSCGERRWCWRWESWDHLSSDHDITLNDFINRNYPGVERIVKFREEILGILFNLR